MSFQSSSSTTLFGHRPSTNPAAGNLATLRAALRAAEQASGEAHGNKMKKQKEAEAEMHALVQLKGEDVSLRMRSELSPEMVERVASLDRRQLVRAFPGEGKHSSRAPALTRSALL